MTLAAPIRMLRLWLLAATTLAFVLALTVAAPSPALAQSGFDPVGPGFVEPGTGSTGDTDTSTPGTTGQTAPVGGQTAPVGGVQAGFGGTADEGQGLGAPHAAASVLLVLVTGGLVAQRRRTTS